MKNKKLEKLNIDFLFFEKERKKIILIKRFLIMFLLLFIFFAGISYTIKTRQLNDFENKLQKINQEMGSLNNAIIEKEKLIKNYIKKRKKIIETLNSFIDKKGYPIKEDINFIKESSGEIMIYNFFFREGFSIKLDISSNNFKKLIRFKNRLEKKFSVKIGSDEKRNGLYYQTIILKRENE